MRTTIRTVLLGLLVGSLGLGSAWAGASLVPAPPVGDTADALGQATDRALDVDGIGSVGSGSSTVTPSGRGTDAPPPPSETEGRLPAGWFRAGTAVESLVPRADRWVQGGDCTGAPEQLYTPLTPEGCLITFDMRWADGVDEDNPIEVRSVALGNGEQTVVLSTMDLVGYMASYPADVCADCGLAQIHAALAAELDIPVEQFVTVSSHTHAAPSTIAKGPAWYYEQVRDQVTASIRAAVADMQANPPVRIETGAVAAKEFNTDRRLVDRAVPDYELNWLRAFVPGQKKSPERTIATLGNFAIHPTVRVSNAQLHSGLVGPFVERLEDELGGTGLFFPGGLGDQRVDRGFGVYGLGAGMAERLLGDLRRGGTLLESNDIEAVRTEVTIPVENQFFTAALAVGYAVRDILPPFGGGPVTVTPQKGGANAPSCEGAGALHVVGPVSGIRLGARSPGGKVAVGDEYALPVDNDSIVLVTAPGEIFASISTTVKDHLSRSSNAFVLGMANDTLGYMIPSNQYDLTGAQGLGLANNATNLGNYEEALSLGRCTGDIVMKAMLEVGQALGTMGEGEGP